MLKSRTRILIADDHAVLRQSLRVFLQQEEGLEVVAEAENGRSVLDQLAKLRPQVVIMDISMPELNGVEATRQLLQVDPTVLVIALPSTPTSSTSAACLTPAPTATS